MEKIENEITIIRIEKNYMEIGLKAFEPTFNEEYENLIHNFDEADLWLIYQALEREFTKLGGI